jgi:catechol 2,3-dioxygenase-like lactoylglutathione lyase family enzyme
MKLEVVVLPVTDVGPAKRFYESLGWRLDADFPVGDDFRVVQLTPPGSEASIIFGDGITSAEPGSVEALQLTVFDIDAARVDLARRGVEVSEIFHDRGTGRRPGAGARRLRLVRVVQRPGRQRVAAAGDQGPAAGTRERHGHAVRRRERPVGGAPARGDGARRA